VFKLAAFGLEASVKMSSPLLSAYYAVSITHWSSSSHADTMQIGQWKSFSSKLHVVLSEWQTGKSLHRNNFY